MTCYLLDTNICIYIINKRPPEVYRRFREIQLQQLHISTITLFELYYGLEKSQSHKRNEAYIQDFIAPLKIVDFTMDAARKAESIRYQLQKKGTPIGAYDLQIAAIALARDMVLLTNNTGEFKRVDGLNLENWVG